ncbi:MAG: hypothetical protein EAZ61_00395 [Oscillatoriales cyanobacterium]|nr:MAG: hypothetical protein EAZ61_00395 [Oscillatoriales cyanobacterium]
MSGIKSLIVLVLLVIAGLVLVQNQTPVAVIFLGMSSPMLPLGLWVMAAVAVGSLTMGLLAFLVSIGGAGRPQPRSRLPKQGPNNPAPESKPPRRRFGKQAEPPIEDTTEVWDDDTAWDDRDRQVSQFVPDLEPPSEPWELLEEDATPGKADQPLSSVASSETIAAESRDPEALGDPDESDDSEERGEPLNLPPTSDYELHQQPVEVYRQGSVYSFSYAKKPSEPDGVPLKLGKTGGSRSPNADRRMPIDLPHRETTRPLDPLDTLEEITPIIEPDDRPVSPPKPARPTSPSDRLDPPDASRSSATGRQFDPPDETPPNRTPAKRPEPTPEGWDQDWSQPADDDSDWI